MKTSALLILVQNYFCEIWTESLFLFSSCITAHNGTFMVLTPCVWVIGIIISNSLTITASNKVSEANDEDFLENLSYPKG